jgi:hypothetical protein
VRPRNRSKLLKVLPLELTGSCAGSIRVDKRARVRDLRIFDVEPILPVEPEAKLVLDRLRQSSAARAVRRPSTMPSA